MISFMCDIKLRATNEQTRKMKKNPRKQKTIQKYGGHWKEVGWGRKG